MKPLPVFSEERAFGDAINLDEFVKSPKTAISPVSTY
jgi:hypothetical protein